MGRISTVQTCRLCGFGVQIPRCPQHMAWSHRVACHYSTAWLSLQCPAEYTLPLPPLAPQTLPAHLLSVISPHILSQPSLCAAVWGFHQDNGDAPKSLSPIHGATASLLGTIATRQFMNNSKWHQNTEEKAFFHPVVGLPGTPALHFTNPLLLSTAPGH